jgi:hypothetical protein
MISHFQHRLINRSIPSEIIQDLINHGHCHYDHQGCVSYSFDKKGIFNLSKIKGQAFMQKYGDYLKKIYLVQDIASGYFVTVAYKR